MADNVTIQTEDGQIDVATKDVAGVHFQKVNSYDPTAGSTAAIGVAANPWHVQGTVAVSGTSAVSAASLPLPTGAATEATLSTLNGKVTAVNTGAVTISAALPSGTNNIGDVDVVSSALPTGAATAANQATIIGHIDGIEAAVGSIQGAVSSDGAYLDVKVSAGTTNHAVVSASASTVQLAAASSTRVGIVIWNNSASAILYVRINAAAVIATADFPIHPGERWEPFVAPREVINGIWSSASGAAHVTEFTP